MRCCLLVGSVVVKGTDHMVELCDFRVHSLEGKIETRHAQTRMLGSLARTLAVVFS